MKKVLIWDIENISFKYRFDIINIIPPDTVKYIVSKRKIPKKQHTKLLSLGFQIFFAKKHETADEKIIDIMKILRLSISDLYIVSSDTDFVPATQKMKPFVNKIHYVIETPNKRGILMQTNLTDKQNMYHFVGPDKRKKKDVIVQHSKKEKREIKARREKRKALKNKILESLKTKNVTVNKKNEKQYVKIDGQMYFLTLDEWFEKQAERITLQRLTELNSFGICDICKEEHLLKSAGCYDIHICETCEKEWIYKQKEYELLFESKRKYYDIPHQERFIKFFQEKDIEYKINNFISYTFEDFDIIERTFNKLNIPSVFCKDVEENEILIHSDKFENNPFADFFCKK